MRDEQVLGEEIFGEVVELGVLGAEAVGSCYAAYAGHFVHILLMQMG